MANMKIIDIKKSDALKQIVYAEVYLPMIPDSDGDFMTAETIETAAHKFMKGLRLKSIDVEHNNDLIPASVVESFIARPSDPDFFPGSWVVGVHVEDPDVWDMVMKGELNGFSIQGLGLATETEIELEIPEYVNGHTHESQGHSHVFTVRFTETGGFLGGRTDEVEGHSHVIRKGTATEFSGDHNHRFAFVELIHGT